MRARRACCIGLLLAATAAAALAILYSVRQTLLPPLARWLDVGVRPQRGAYDAVMVLGGDDDVRPFVGAALYKAGFARRVLLANVESHPDADPEFAPPRHGVSRQILLLRGVPASDMQVVGKPCESTFDEARALSGVLDAEPELRVLVVTSDYHTRRARWVFAHVLGDRAAQVTFVSAPTERIPPQRWWRSEAGFRAVASEYVKLLLYGLRYGTLAYWVAGLAFGAAGACLAWRLRQRRRRRCAGRSGCADNAAAVDGNAASAGDGTCLSAGQAGL